MNIVVYIATSLDGYIADKQGNIDWLTSIENPENLDFGFADFLSGIDAIVMGRTTFETIMGFDIEWPYEQPVFILSNTIKELPVALPDNVSILSGNVTEIIKKLKGNGYNRVYIDGGKTVQGFINEGFVDELIITRIPILLGEGIPLFIPNDKRIEFTHHKTEIYLDSFVKSHYKKIN
ncbi:dihydrofolate reductase [Proteus vulgaris]|nr:dihydrofolate reductase [Proteus vulgaris]